MSLGFIYGPAGVDRQANVLGQLQTWQQEQSNAEIFYIVPDHIKFESEVTVLDHLRQQKGQPEKMFASANVQTFSFSRLMWYFLKEQPSLSKTKLTATGLAMIVTHILHEFDEQDLHVFNRERNSPGFSKKLAEQIVELKLGGFTPDDLEQSAQNLQQNATGERADLSARLHDLVLVYRKFEQYTAGQYLDTADSLDELIDYLENANLSQSYFMLDGFMNFNAKEKEVLAVLMQRAAEVRISLILDRPYLDAKPETTELFYQTGRVYYEFTQMARANHVHLLMDQQAHTPRVAPDLLSLEQFWRDSQSFGPKKNYHLKSQSSLILTETPDRVREVRYIAAKIRQLVFSGRYHYHDFLILAPQQAKYQNLLENIFSEYEIPVFTDLNKTMLNHPLVEFILALFSVKQQNYSYRSMMRLLKTEIYVPELKEKHWSLGTFRNTVDLMENCILQNGYYSGFYWKNNQDWIVQTCGMQPNETEKEHQARQQNLPNNLLVNQLRREIYHQLNNFFTKIDQVKSGREFAVELINFLEKIGVPQTLQAWQASAAKDLDLESDPTRLLGSISSVSRHEEVWNTLCSLLDEYVTALGAEPLNLDEFITILSNGFENAQYSQVPSTLDQVIFSESGVVQMANRQVLFFIGLNDTVLPRSFENQALLSDHDRQELENLEGEEQSERYLSDTSDVLMAEEPFAAYLAFMSVKKRIFFSYPLSDNDGQALQLSPYIERIKNAFSLTTNSVAAQFQAGADAIDDLVGTKKTSLGELIAVSRDAFHNGADLHAVWRGLYQYLRSNYGPATQYLLQSLGFANEILPNTQPADDGHKYLNADVVASLYGTQINTSISKLETFFADPYQYFLQYGLKLRPRDEFLLQPADTGQYFHSIMEYFFQNVLRAGETLAQLTSNEFDKLMAQTIQQVNEELGSQIFSSTARYRYTRRQLNRTASQVVHAIARQRQNRQIFTVKTETTFGDQGGLPALIYSDPQTKQQMRVRGRIDRIDLVAAADGQPYYNVVDYKSGNPESKMDKFLLRTFNGLSLQLLTYLRALQQAADSGDLAKLLNYPALAAHLKTAKTEPELGSASYLHLFDPVLKNEQKLAEKFDKSFMYKGIFRRGQDNSAEENDFLLALDEEIEAGVQNNEKASSRNYPIKYQKTKHELKASSTKSLLLTLDQINQLLAYNDLKMQEARAGIFSGLVDLAPYRLGINTGLDYSDYQEIMMFDPLLAKNNYRQIPELTEAEIWKKINELLSEGSVDK